MTMFCEQEDEHDDQSTLDRQAGIAAAALAVAMLLSGTAATAEPMFSQTDPIDAPPASNVVIWADEVFDFAGPNPEITEADFSDTKYYTSIRIHDGALRLRGQERRETEPVEAAARQPLFDHGGGDDDKRLRRDGLGHADVEDLLRIYAYGSRGA